MDRSTGRILEEYLDEIGLDEIGLNQDSGKGFENYVRQDTMCDFF
jgi:hypothetical protein